MMLSIGLSWLGAAALTQAQPTSKCSTFDIISLRSTSPVHLSTWSASRSSLSIKLPDQKAKCDGGDDNDNQATFFLEDGGLYLYSDSKRPQQIFVDRSGMGQGKIGYITGTESAPADADLKGWVRDDSDNLTFNGTDLIACPGGPGGSWSIWLSVGLGEPAGHKGCLGFVARAQGVEDPVSCEYTS